MSEPDLELRRIGEYGHFVAPLSQLAADVQAFTGRDLTPYLAETRAIMRDDQGVHPEEAAVLYMLTRACKPRIVLETGTFKGYSSSEIARALKANASGHLLTVDIAADTGEAVPAELTPHITFHRSTPSRRFAAEWPVDSRIDLFFHDSLHTFLNTFGELTWFARHYAAGAVIVCHDAKMDFMDGFGVGKAVRLFSRRLGVPFQVLDTTCGLAMLQWPEHVSAQAMEDVHAELVRLEKEARGSWPRRVLRRIARR